ncbi:hypothetical protein [Sphingosinithalassobacter sp. LHW66-3]|uniref:hypothetical protein n=1 Tax=Sphingosinithalassobacter sp. LHW66-3 TaxID=3424718 RepID=UPI003D6AE940
MMSLLTSLLFSGVLLASLWTIISTVLPRAPRALFLLRCGPVVGAELPPRPRGAGRGPVVRVQTVSARGISVAA